MCDVCGMEEDKWITINVEGKPILIKKEGQAKKIWFKVQGKDENYTISLDYSCECKSHSLFPYRLCKHVKAALKFLYERG